MRRFKFIGTEEDALRYSGSKYPEDNRVYYETEEFGGRSIAYWVDSTPFVGEEWEQVIDDVGTYSVTNTDPVNPSHYKNGEVECIEAIKSAVVGKDGFEGYLVGNVIKYLWRFEEKGGLTDLDKSRWYLNKLIEYEKDKTKT